MVLLFALHLFMPEQLGNLIDSAFYGLIFDKEWCPTRQQESILVMADWLLFQKWICIFLHGNVVDMLYFPVIKGISPMVPLWGRVLLSFSGPYSIWQMQPYQPGNSHFSFPEKVFQAAQAYGKESCSGNKSSGGRWGTGAVKGLSLISKANA